MSFLKEFKEFALKGNAIDLAVGVVIGTSFNKVISSLVNDIILPPIGLLLGSQPFAQLALTLQEEVVVNNEIVKPLISLRYGAFIQNIIDFSLIALSVFLVVKFLNRLGRTRQKK